MSAKRPYFEPVDLGTDFPKEEKKLLSLWYKNGTVIKYLTKNNNSKKTFSFLDGPITANNPMGVHHAWGRTYKDLWQRFKNMQGFRQRFQNGFDAQGLWVEVEVEKELGFKDKKEIEKFGVAKFVDLCKKRVKKYSEIQTEQSKRLGYFMDWDHSYYTLSEDNNYMIWHFLKVCFENGWLYKGNDSVPWCPRCETAISQHEMLTEDYKEITHESVYLAFPLLGGKNDYFLVWTTTPWTIPANISIAVDASLEYVKVEFASKKYWIAKDAVERVFAGVEYKILKSAPGAKLVGLRYEGAFDNLPKVGKVARKYHDKFHNIIATDNMILPITTTEGTGLVHTAVSAGSEDFKLGQKLGLPMIPVIKDDASYMDDLGFLSGQNAKKNPRLILDYLERLNSEGKHFMYKIEKYTHRYPACWRCKTELVWKVTDEWYISMDKPSVKEGRKDARTLREKMIGVAKKINWIPGFGLDRELDWLTNMHDWLISKKNRYWGLALPIWECAKCGSFEVVGSKEELQEKAVEGLKSIEGKSPHKPQIDKVKIKCAKCGQIMSRIEPVGNPWLDAGIVAYSTVSSNNKACNFDVSKEKPLYMSDKDEWSQWIPADFITESFPGQFKNWFYSLIAMSTVLEDAEPFKTVLGFGTLLAEDGRPMHKSWGNSIEFGEGADKIGVDVMRWMYARQNPADNLLFGYRIGDETRRKFHLKVWNVYNFFVTYANLDEWRPVVKASKSQNILDIWIRARMSETVGKVTKFLEDYDAFMASGEIEKFVDDLSLWYIRRSRDRVGPVSESPRDKNSFYKTTHYILITLSKILAPFTPFFSETMYKNLTKDFSVHLAEWPKAEKENKEEFELVHMMSVVREIVELGHSKRKEIGIPVKQPLSKLMVNNYLIKNKELVKLVENELNVKSVDFKDGKGDLKVDLDIKITPELEEEAKARDLVRKIQAVRKDMGLNLTQKVDVKNDWIPSDINITRWIMKKAQILNITNGEFKVIKTS